MMKRLKKGLMTVVSEISVVTIEDNVRKKGSHEKRRKEMDRVVKGRMMMDSRRMKNVVDIGKEMIVGSCMLVDSGTDSDNCCLDTG